VSKKNKAIIAVVAVLVIGGAAAAFAVSASGVHEVEVADVTTEDLAVVVSAAGAVEADTRADVYPPTAGTLATLDVAEGDEVRAGTVLATMDTAPIEIQIAQAEAAYRGALAQRSAITNSAPGSSDLNAAQAAVDAAWSGYSLANAAYEAALAGVGAPSAGDIAQAQALVAVAQTSATTAQSAYDSFYNDVYLPATLPRDATLEGTLAALTLARNQAAANLVDAQTALGALLAASSNGANIAQAKIARDQAYAAYLGAQSQRDALAKASNVSGALASADAAVAAARSALAFASDTLERAQIVAPIDGVVLFSGSSAASLFSATGGGSGGADLSVGASVTPASAPFAIVSFDTLAFRATVDETDIARVEEGMSARVLLDGIAATEFTAEVVSIGKESQLTATGGTAFPVLLRFASGGERVLLGMNGSTDIEVETIGSATTMPIEALLEDGDSTYVYTVRDGRARRTDITVGRMTDTRVEVLSGLADGEEVVVSGVADLSDGARVRTVRE
jgi:macrolide-specific efflux system membrane fusion protein